ncbi:hypothetical protein HOA93_05850 [bacterium]|nr:hypothetical protein [bacterium]
MSIEPKICEVEVSMIKFHNESLTHVAIYSQVVIFLIFTTKLIPHTVHLTVNTGHTSVESGNQDIYHELSAGVLAVNVFIEVE